jgi:hypothetical protein
MLWPALTGPTFMNLWLCIETPCMATALSQGPGFDVLSQCRHETEKALQASDSTEQLLPFLRSAGSVILGILGLQQQHRAFPEFNIPAPLEKQGLNSSHHQLPAGVLPQKQDWSWII